ncbi:hypothetical protein [uncultured Salinicola sp.]|uniref:hypothetical protein n=1 Tax=uncultured Salinicola sp. TaxID=1193542 RepID=UPI002632E1AF|nr:hypothetical protein [uncultured Salinicola sp.]|tara:strand:- start:10 stop:396 length:387 start_codon:yes stop_codon:yes gene_type:complete
MNIILELIAFLGLIILVFVLPVIVLPLTIGNLIHRRRYPEDTELVRIYLERVRDNPDSFTVECDSSIEAADDVFKAASYGSLRANGRSLSKSTWQEMKISRSVKKLWKRNGQTDAKKKALIERLTTNG